MFKSNQIFSEYGPTFVLPSCNNGCDKFYWILHSHLSSSEEIKKILNVHRGTDGHYNLKAHWAKTEIIVNL